jgi:nucleotide-binding universal stress UspA family protein
MIRNILVPTDFSAGSDAALACARELASAVGASLHLMHVVENPFAPGGFMEMYPLPAGYEPGDLEDAAAKRLEACLTADDTSARHATITTRMGIPAREILQRLDQEPTIDLVVMATHGRGGVARMVMGSVADKVVRGAHCPVLTLKECTGYERGAQ